VSAFNDLGVGVYSRAVLVRTAEGRPQAAPTRVDVVALTSTSIRVTFTPPPQPTIPGVNLGYKVECALHDDVARRVVGNRRHRITFITGDASRQPAAGEDGGGQPGQVH